MLKQGFEFAPSFHHRALFF